MKFVNAMTRKQKKMFYRILGTFGIAAIYLLLDILGVFNLLPFSDVFRFGVLLLAYFLIGYDILLRAFLGVKNGQIFDENFLMAVATIGAIGLGDVKEGVAVMLFYQIGELFQNYAVGKSRKNIASLMDIRPDTANLLGEDGEVTVVDPDEVTVGQTIVVYPGEKVPMDGIVVSGNSMLDTKALTGESIPRQVKEQDEIFSGCVNMSGVIYVRTTKEFGQSTASKILELVESSGMKKSKSENFITKFAKVYTPFVCIAALVLALLPPVINLISGDAMMFGMWLKRALTFLVISCPCALVISIPLSFFGGIGGASAKGILIKGSNYLEQLAKAKYVVFDKTGTLTKGDFSVTDIILSKDCPVKKEELLYLAACAEQYSSHPIAKSILSAYESNKDAQLMEPEDMHEAGGYGITCKLGDKRCYVGNMRLLDKYQILADTTGLEDVVGTVIYVAVDEKYAGAIVISDSPKEESKKAITMLQNLGIKTVMLTGDAKKVAQKIAKDLGISEVRSELLPQDKVTEVETLLSQKKKGEVLCFVGDGMNDAPVLSRADIGIAMGALGSDAAIEASDIVLMDDNPLKIATALKVSKKTLRICYENIAFALLVKGICLLLGALGYAGMWLAIFADVGVMVLAVLNAARALKLKE